MKVKTLGWIFATIVMGIAFSISSYVLYYVCFAKDISNFSMLFLGLCCTVMIISPFLFTFLIDYCTDKEDKI